MQPSSPQPLDYCGLKDHLTSTMVGSNLVSEKQKDIKYWHSETLILM